MNIHTVGYEGLNIQSFLNLLRYHDIQTVIDIRQMPLSRKFGFSKTSLSNFLQSSGFSYVHMAKFGCPKAVRDEYRERQDWTTYTRGYLNYIYGEEPAIEALSDIAQKSNCALLCFEADFNYCHRSLVADLLNARFGFAVQHIQAPTLKSKLAEAQMLLPA